MWSNSSEHNVAAGAPGRDDEHRHPLAEAVGSGGISGEAAGVLVEGGVRGGAALGRGGRRVGRYDVVEVAVVLVVGDEQRRLRPDLRVGGQRVQHLGDVPGSVVGGEVGVFGERLGGGDPGDLGEPARLDVGLELVEEAVALLGVGAGAGLVVERVAGPGVAVRVEVEQRVVAVVAAVGVLDPAPVAVRVEAVADVLVDLPGDAGLLQAFGVGGPAVAGLLVAQDWAAPFAVVPGVPAPHVVAVGVGGADHRAVVGVADGEGVGERVVEGDVLPGQIRHGAGALGGDPLVVPTLVPRLVAARPVVVEAGDELHAEVLGVGVVGQYVLVSVGLLPDRPVAGRCRGAGVAEAAHSAQGAEVVVEGPVLLHQHDDVLDVVDRAGTAGRGDGCGPRDAAGEGGEARGRARLSGGTGAG